MNKGLLATLALILIILASFISYNQWPLWFGESVVLATRPVDPFDPFRGQYMTINYEISELNLSANLKKGDTVYVSLSEDETGVWRATQTSNEKSNGVFIKGTVLSQRGRQNIEYGVEQFFFERRANLPTQNITVEVMIAKSGRPALKQLLHNGKPINLGYDKIDWRS